MTKNTARITYQFPVVIHREGNVWGYASLQFGGGGAASEAEAMESAVDLISSCVSEHLEAGSRIPLPIEPSVRDIADGRLVYVPVEVPSDL